MLSLIVSLFIFSGIVVNGSAWRTFATTNTRRTTLLHLSSIDDSYFRRPGPWDEKDLNSLMTANKVWANKLATESPAFFEDIKKGHAPKILWIGCSDARYT